MVVTANPAFEEKMSKLTAMIEEQSKNITRLEETASALREEKLKTEEVTRQSIAELRQDRKAAGDMLDTMASKYMTDMDTGKQAMEKAIRDLHAQKDALLREREQQGPGAGVESRRRCW